MSGLWDSIYKWGTAVTFSAFCLSLTWSTEGLADLPRLDLGPKPSFGLFQPRVTVDISTAPGGSSLGPDNNTFLLDTAANGVVIFPPATQQLTDNGLVNEGVYTEIGVTGDSEFQVSAPYHLSFNGTDGEAQTMDNVRFMSGSRPVDPTGLMGLDGIVGMSGMVGKVTTIDNRTREGAPSLSMGLTFSDQLPTTSTHRFSIPFTKTVFEVEDQGGPTPTWSEALPTVDLNAANNGKQVTTPIVFDTGAQLTIISEDFANSLGLDANGNGDFLDEATTTVPISGATGSIDAPVLVVDRMGLQTEQGFELSWTSAEVIVLDIDPSISGVLGSDFLTGDGGLNLSFLGGGGGTGGLGDLGDLLGGGGLGDLGDLLGGGGLGDLSGLLGGGGLGDLSGLLGGGGGIDINDLLGGLGGAGEDDPLDGILDGLGGLGGVLGGGDLFASFPLESNFDRIHLDFREYEEGTGRVYFDLNPQISETILNGDHVLDVADIDEMTALVGDIGAGFDLDGDGLVTSSDRDSLIADVFGTVAGDVDLDGDVDFSDFLVMSASFNEENGGWGSGDFDGSGLTDFADFLALSTNFTGINAAASQSVPEPSSMLVAIGLCTAMCLRRRK